MSKNENDTIDNSARKTGEPEQGEKYGCLMYKVSRSPKKLTHQLTR